LQHPGPGTVRGVRRGDATRAVGAGAGGGGPLSCPARVRGDGTRASGSTQVSQCAGRPWLALECDGCDGRRAHRCRHVGTHHARAQAGPWLRSGRAAGGCRRPPHGSRSSTHAPSPARAGANRRGRRHPPTRSSGHPPPAPSRGHRTARGRCHHNRCDADGRRHCAARRRRGSCRGVGRRENSTAGGLTLTHGPCAGLWLQVEASRRQNDPRKATGKFQLLIMVRLRSKSCPDEVPVVDAGWSRRVWGQRPGQPRTARFASEAELPRRACSWSASGAEPLRPPAVKPFLAPAGGTAASPPCERPALIGGVVVPSLGWA
jgi:hypothetical protein